MIWIKYIFSGSSITRWRYLSSGWQRWFLNVTFLGRFRPMRTSSQRRDARELDSSSWKQRARPWVSARLRRRRLLLPVTAAAHLTGVLRAASRGALLSPAWLECVATSVADCSETTNLDFCWRHETLEGGCAWSIFFLSGLEDEGGGWGWGGELTSKQPR